MSSAGFEPAILAFTRLQTYGLDRRGHRHLHILMSHGPRFGETCCFRL